ncbi:MAG: sigma-70 family RNA polymerase sigma factor, partial [Opitutae bacterium]|nr:sigma-70 family RNA polymerase sigma factor [Opitutae bacterium]
ARTYAVACRLVGPHDAEDVVMDTFLKAWQALPRFRGGRGLSAWLMRIARNQALDLLRRRQVRQAESLEDDYAAETAAALAAPGVESPADQAAYDDRAGLVRDALTRLPPAQRMAMSLRYMDGLSYAEIAAATAILSLLVIFWG